MADLLYDTVFPQEKPQPEAKPEPEKTAAPQEKPLREVGLIYTELTKKALAICFDAHKHQKDKAGLPYIFHPIHVAEQLETEEEICTALLHDVLEDSFYTERDLKMAGFPDTVLEAIRLLTRQEGEDYLAYAARVRKDPIARRVKLADLKHNSDLTRLDQVTEQDRNRVLKYTMAQAVLREDPWDDAGESACKTIPLSTDNQAKLLVFYDAKGTPLKYRLEPGDGSGFSMEPGAAEELRLQLDPESSLPMVLSRYGKSHNWSFEGLFR